MKRLLLWGAAIVVAAPVAWADDFPIGSSVNTDVSTGPLVPTRPRLERRRIQVDRLAPVADTNKLFLNDCRPNGCMVAPGNVNSVTNRWPLDAGARVLTPFTDGDAKWEEVVMCMREVFGPFGVNITTTDPGNVPHFEIMIAGNPTDLAFSEGVGGISTFDCGAPAGFIPNALVFAFSNVWQGDVEEICATAAQEIAHSFLLDHATVASDPLTYFGFNGRRRFVNDDVQCGSDCGEISGKPVGISPFNRTCTGPDINGTGPQNHVCECTGAQTQNSHQTILDLFGDGTPTPPLVTLATPRNNTKVIAGFPMLASMKDDQANGKVEFRVDGQLVATVAKAPYAANAPAGLADGPHTVEVTGFDVFDANAKVVAEVTVGPPCKSASDCEIADDVCIGGRCVPGPNAEGGLGQLCNNGDDCASGMCGTDDTGARHCVEICEEGQCPSGFGCLETVVNGGVCWPGYDDDGGCLSGGRGGLGLGLGLGLTLALVLRRRRATPVA